VLGNHKLVREIGRGGMSIVYLATQLDLKRPVALKILRPGLAVERSHVERFEREARSIARLQHPHIVQVHAVGETDGWHWIAMEYVEGKSLAQVYAALPAAEPDPRRWTAASLAAAAGVVSIGDGTQSYATALCALLAPVARAIGLAHEIGLVHRDVKPSNILVHKDGRALIADFGLAKGEGDPGLSLTGEPIGTPYYMSPEQAAISAQKIDLRTDVYSLGVTLYEGLAGRRPFEGGSALAVMDAIRHQSPQPLARFLPRGDVEVEALVDVAMAPRPEDRFADAFELARDLESFATGRPTRAAATRGGEWQRFRRALRASRQGGFVDYRTRAEPLGLPLVHVHFGRPPQGHAQKQAQGWIACGNRARGVFAFGGLAQGVFAFGGMALGLVSFGGMSLGLLLAWGGMAVGGLSYGGVAVGYGAAGGLAVGRYAVGGKAYGEHVYSSTERDPAAVEFFERIPLWTRGMLIKHEN
jgi:serine/threonine protein kinase